MALHVQHSAVDGRRWSVGWASKGGTPAITTECRRPTTKTLQLQDPWPAASCAFWDKLASLL